MSNVAVQLSANVKITVLGEEGVPIEVDEEAWLNPPGTIEIIHKNIGIDLRKGVFTHCELYATLSRVKS